ncbi:MAG TPA: glycosyltransferase family 39 protein [Pseudomonadales bacterium]|nr:glycosyltransferase family 39 protein [Pseudomonadales bacterium]
MQENRFLQPSFPFHWLFIPLLVYFTAFLGTHPLVTPDEGRYPDVARHMLLSGDWVVPYLNGTVFFHKPILYYWLETLSMHVFGINAWAIRLPGALTGFFGCVLVYQASRRLFGEPVARIATVILATNPLYFVASQFADMNLEVGVLIASAVLCFFVAEAGKTSRTFFWRMLAWMFMGLAILAKGLIGIVLPAMVFGLWVLLFNQWRRLPAFCFVRGILLLLAIVAPWFFLMEQREPGFLHYFIVVQHFERYSGTNFNNVQPFWFYPAVLLLGFMPWMTDVVGIVKRLPLTRQFADTVLQQPAGGRMVWMLLIWIVAMVCFFSMPASKVMGYILPVMPAVALLIACDLQNGKSFPLHSKIFFAVFLLLTWAYVVSQVIKADDKTLWVLSAAVASTAITFGGAIFFWRRQRSAFVEAAGVAIMMALFNLSCLIVVPAFTHHNQVVIADIIQSHWHENDRMVFYEKYYYDIPIYVNTRKPVTVVTNWEAPQLPNQDGWRNELWFGRDRDPVSRQWLIMPSQLESVVAAANVTGAGNLFVVADEKDCPVLLEKYPLKKIAVDGSACLLVQQASTLAVLQ